MKKIILGILAVALLSGCGSNLKLTPEPQKGQKKVFNNGNEVVVSSKRSSVLLSSLTPTYKSNTKPKIFIGLKNRTSKSFNFSTENVQAFVDGKPHKIYTYEELADEIETSKKWAAVGAALSGMGRSMSAANAGTTYHSGTYNSSSYNTYGTNSYSSGSYSGYSYNSAATQQARDASNAQTQADFKAIKDKEQASLNSINGVVRKTTISPNRFYSGTIVLESMENPKETHTLNMVVTLGNEKHNFILKNYQVK
ncbi:MAG TPA: membrane lipoprotein lipid attachment site-containing protein [Sulfurovum sp.]